MFSLFKRASTVEDFWTWFKANHRAIEARAEFEVDPLMELGAQLHKLDKGLSYDVVSHLDGVHELQISANGDPNLVDLVKSIVEQAPEVVNWKIVAFRQPSEKQAAILFEDRVLQPDDVLFLVTKFSKRGRSADLRVAVPGLTERNAKHLANCATVLMESIIGELPLMTCFDSTEFLPAEEVDATKYHALSELGSLVADLAAGVRAVA